MTETRFPRLRAVDAHTIVQGGRPSILLRDPLQLADGHVVIPQQLGPLLALCDGTRDNDALRAALAVRFGLRVGPEMLKRVLTALDDALLLDNERFARARERAVTEYRQAPFRPPVLTDQSYPSDPDGLRRLLQGHTDAADDVHPTLDGGRGLICPHIDYERGASVYAAIWKRAAEMARAADLVVLLGTDHFGEDGRLTLTRQHYATPLGVLPTARDVIEELAQAIGPDVAFAHELNHRSEHSIELAAVWLHFVRGGEPCQLVPVLCGSFDHFVRGSNSPERDPSVNALLDALKQTLSARRTLVVAAADLSHVGPAFGGKPQGLVERVRVQAADDQLIDRVCAGDAHGFYAAIEREGNRHNVCGLPPIYLALRLLSPVEGERVAYQSCSADGRGTSLVSVCGVLLR